MTRDVHGFHARTGYRTAVALRSIARYDACDNALPRAYTCLRASERARAPTDDALRVAGLFFFLFFFLFLDASEALQLEGNARTSRTSERDAVAEMNPEKRNEVTHEKLSRYTPQACGSHLAMAKIYRNEFCYIYYKKKYLFLFFRTCIINTKKERKTK